MVNKKGGKEYKKYKSRSKQQEQVRLISKNDYENSIYAKVDSLLGGNRLYATGENKQNYNCVIRGRLMNKDRIIKGDIIIILERDFENNDKNVNIKIADIIHKCSIDEIDFYDIDTNFEFVDNNQIGFDNNNIVFDKEDNIEFDKL